MSPVTAPADRRFRRAHVKPGRRRRWTALVKPFVMFGLLAAAALYALYEGGMVVAHARSLQIDDITVRGNARLANGVVAAALDGLRGQNILWSDLGAARQRVLESPWVKDVALRRVLPSTIEVVIRERQPIGLARLDGELYLVDDEGVVIDRYGPAYGGLDLPIIDGLSTAAEPEGVAVNRDRAELAARLVASLRPNPDVGGRLSQVDVSDPRNVAVILRDDPALIFVGTERFLQRLEAYLQLAETMRSRVDGIDYVDLRLDDRIVVRPAGASPAPRPRPAGVVTPPARAKSR